MLFKLILTFVFAGPNNNPAVQHYEEPYPTAQSCVAAITVAKAQVAQYYGTPHPEVFGNCIELNTGKVIK
jgi:hypothetical protein